MAGYGNRPGRGTGGRVRVGVPHHFRPGERMKAFAFPDGAIAKAALGRGAEGFNGDQRQNIAKAVEMARKQHPDLEIRKVSDRRNPGVAWVTSSANRYTGEIVRQRLTINTAASFWKDPSRVAREARRVGFWSSSSPAGVIRHELGHVVHKPTLKLRYGSTPGSASRVSRYAATNAMEFMAETYAGLRSGQRYPRRVMERYRELQGGTGQGPARPRRINPAPSLIRP